MSRHPWRAVQELPQPLQEPGRTGPEHRAGCRGARSRICGALYTQGHVLREHCTASCSSWGPVISGLMALLGPVQRGAAVARADPRLVPVVEGSPHPFTMKQDVGCGFFIDALFENTLET